MSRRANGAGSLTQRADGAWLARVSTPDGRRKRVITREPGERPAAHRRRAEAVLGELRDEIAKPATRRERWTVQEWATERYLPSVAARNLSPATMANYRDVLRAYVFPAVGAIALDALAPDDVDAMDARLRDENRSLRTRRAARAALDRVVRHAVAKDRVTSNPVARADRLASDGRDPTDDVLQPDQVRALLVAARGDDMELPIVLMAVLGLRRGEALGLCWTDVDVDRARIRITRNLISVHGHLILKSPKTRKSTRTLELSAPVVELLRQRRARQAQARLAAGALWQGPMIDHEGRPGDLVTTDEAGRPVNPSRLGRIVAQLGRQIGVEGLHPHRLRHGYVSLLLAEGHDLAAVAAAAGHSSAGVTANIYSHALDRTRVAATSAMAAAVGDW